MFYGQLVMSSILWVPWGTTQGNGDPLAAIIVESSYLVVDSLSPAYPLDLYVWETVSGHISSLIPTWVLLNFKLTVGV